MQAFVKGIEFLAKVNDITFRLNLILDLTGELIMQAFAENIKLSVILRDMRSKLVENFLGISRKFAFVVELFSEVVNLALLIGNEGSEFSSLEGHHLYVATSLIFDKIDFLLDKLHCGTEVRDFEVGGLFESHKRGGESINNFRNS